MEQIYNNRSIGYRIAVYLLDQLGRTNTVFQEGFTPI